MESRGFPARQRLPLLVPHESELRAAICSTLYSHKKLHRIHLMAMYDANYKFVYVDVGAEERCTGSLVITSGSRFGRAVLKDKPIEIAVYITMVALKTSYHWFYSQHGGTMGGKGGGVPAMVRAVDSASNCTLVPE